MKSVESLNVIDDTIARSTEFGLETSSDAKTIFREILCIFFYIVL